MTDKEVKRLSRSQLIEIIYQLQTREEELTDKNRRLEEELRSKRIRMENAGNIAEAALELNDVFRSAQNAAAQYLSEIQIVRETAEKERQQIILAAQEEARQIIQKAKDEASLIIDDTQRTKKNASVTPCKPSDLSDLSVDAILSECRELFKDIE